MKEVKLLSKVDVPNKPNLVAGIDETLDVVRFFVAAANAYNSAAADGKFTLTDLPLVIEPARKLIPALTNLGLVPSELLDVDLSEADEIVNVVASELEIELKDAEQIITHAFKALYHIKEIVLIV